MILADALYDLTQHTLVTDTPWADAIRMAIAVIAFVVAALLGRLYVTHRTGGMTVMAGAGAVATYVVVAWAQVVAASSPTQPRDISVLNIAVLTAVTLSLLGTLQSMRIYLFSHGQPEPSRAQAQSDEIDRIGGMVDAIEEAVNTRGDGPTISEDVASIEERGQRDDERREGE
jgi:hypothetical protein